MRAGSAKRRLHRFGRAGVAVERGGAEVIGMLSRK